MGRMKEIYTDTMVLAEDMLSCTSPEQAEALPHDQGWLSPTEKSIAIECLKAGDVLRALSILGDASKDEHTNVGISISNAA